MQVYCLTGIDELQRYADDWDRLAGGVPFRSWTWLSAWWRHFGSEDGTQGRLCVPCVFDESERLVGALPCYVRETVARGRVLRMLGTGKVCSDYLGLLSLPGWEGGVALAVADYLGDDDRPEAECWDLLELSGVDAAHAATGALVDRLAERGHGVYHDPLAPRCWRVGLPRSWDGYLAGLAKHRRRQLRRLDEMLVQSGRARVHRVECLGDLAPAFEVLVDLHQRRRRSLGQRGCFASRRFRAFHAEVAPELLRAGQLQLAWLEISGQPVAAEYHLTGAGIVYAYQGGIAPEWLDHQPGNLLTMLLLRRAIEQGFTGYDFLRGDEPYKADFGAAPRSALEAQIVPDRAAAQARHRLRAAGTSLKRWLKRRAVGT